MRARSAAAVAVIVSAMLSSAADARPVHLALRPLQNWLKACGPDKRLGEPTCYVTRDYGAGGQTVLGLSVHDLQKSHKVVLLFIIPPELIANSHPRFSIDGGHVGATARQACFPNGCFVRADVDRSLLEALKGGDELLLWGRTQSRGDFILHAPLSGFAAAFDGEPIDPKLLARLQKQHRLQQ